VLQTHTVDGKQCDSCNVAQRSDVNFPCEIQCEGALHWHSVTWRYCDYDEMLPPSLEDRDCIILNDV
jgi:hypothetical protein